MIIFYLYLLTDASPCHMGRGASRRGGRKLLCARSNSSKMILYHRFTLYNPSPEGWTISYKLISFFFLYSNESLPSFSCPPPATCSALLLAPSIRSPPPATIHFCGRSGRGSCKGVRFGSRSALLKKRSWSALHRRPAVRSKQPAFA